MAHRGRRFDGRWLAFDKVHTEHDIDVYLYDLQSKEMKHLTPHEGDVAFSAQTFAPDSKSLYLTTNQDSEFSYLVKMDLAGGAPQVVDKPSWDVMNASATS